MTPTVLRIFDDWLQDATNGVNAKLAYLEAQGLLDGDDTPPDVQFVGNAYDDEQVAKAEKPPKRPALYIGHDLPASFSGRDQKPGQIEGAVPVAIRYVTIHGDLVQGRRDAAHTLRALRMSVDELFRNAQRPKRERAGLYLEAYEEILMGEILETVGNAQVTGGMVIRCRTIDQRP